MLNVSPQVLDFLEQVRQIALGYAEAEEYTPWGTRAFYREMKGRDFLYTTEQPDFLEVAFRVPLAKRAELLELPFIEPHKYRDSWLTAKITSQEDLNAVIPYIKLSYDLNKPLRSKADYIEGENDEILDFLEQVRQTATAFGDVEEFFPYGGRAFRKRKGQIFLHANEHDDYLDVDVRLPLGEREYALTLPNVEVPKYIGHKGWVRAKVKTQEELDTVLGWIAVSFDMNQPVRKRKVKS